MHALNETKLPLLNWMMGGEAGYGVFTSGLIFSKCLSRGGYHTFSYKEYPSLIRGGHQSYQVAASHDEIFSQYKELDMLVALDELSIKMHRAEIKRNCAIMYDPKRVSNARALVKRNDILLVPIPLEKIARDVSGSPLLKNTVAIGASCALLHYGLSAFEGIMKDVFGHKGEHVVNENIRSAQHGYDYASLHFAKRFPKHLSPQKRGRTLMNITGNEAVAFGALQAGCTFYAAYPMTPASSLLSVMASHELEYGVVVKHAEDEIAVINMAIGAAHAGARAMVGTAGGGFCLMTEGLGLAGMTETPIVIFIGQRGGPSTGLPTWTSQGDLKFALSASQDDFPRIVYAPGDMRELFYLTHEALNIAERFQTPVMILSDTYLAESHKSEIFFDTTHLSVERGHILNAQEVAEIQRKAVKNRKFSPQDLPFKRYRFTSDPVSPRLLPGTKGGVFLANSDEHDEYGSTNEESKNRTGMMDKRRKKFLALQKEFPAPSWYGSRDAEVTVIAWGSTKLPALEALKHLPLTKANLLHFNRLSPLPFEKTMDALAKIKKAILIEGNQSGQFKNYLYEQTGFKPDQLLTKYNGRPFYPEEIVSAVSAF